MSTFPVIVNNFTHPVILADGRSWARSYARHLETTGLGGDDLAYGLDSNVDAPAAGIWEWEHTYSRAGNIGRIRMPNGWAVVFEHLDHAKVPAGTHVKIGDNVAASGGSGGVTPHLHVHLIDKYGQRHPIYQYFVSLEVAGGGTKPALPKDDDMLTFKTKFYYVAEVNDCRKVGLAEAKAIAAAKGVSFKTVTSAQARLIIDGCKDARLDWLNDQAAVMGRTMTPSQVSAVTAKFDALDHDEDDDGQAAEYMAASEAEATPA